jgi:hypothetical protein
MDQLAPGTLSLQQITRLTGLSAQSIGQLTRKGVVLKAALGSFPRTVTPLLDGKTGPRDLQRVDRRGLSSATAPILAWGE